MGYFKPIEKTRYKGLAKNRGDCMIGFAIPRRRNISVTMIEGNTSRRQSEVKR